MVSATFGVTSLALGGFAAWADFWHIWLTWWLGDGAGSLVIAPVLLLWTENWRGKRPPGEGDGGGGGGGVFLPVVGRAFWRGGSWPPPKSPPPATFFSSPLLAPCS